MKNELLATFLLLAIAAPASAEMAAVPGPEVDLWIARAIERESAGDYDGASDLYLLASAHDPQLSRFLRFRAAGALLQAPDPPADRLAILLAGAESWGFEGAAASAVRVSALGSGGLPDAQTLAVALETDDREPICDWLTGELQSRAEAPESAAVGIVDLHHGYCSDTQVPSFAKAFGHSPTAEARVRRAERLYGQVRFYAAADEIEALGELDAVEPPSLKCRALFRLARTTYRIRKRRSESGPLYRKATEACDAAEKSGLRKSALYGVGKRHYDLNRFDAARPYFETLLSDYPDSSHADDAVFYLARIARAKNDRAKELELMELAERSYQDGDMYTELIWEVFEALYKKGDYQEFIDAVTAIKRPEHDDYYYSQGRLEYFVGQAYVKLKATDEAQQAWHTAWNKYPWSFYGYLSRMRLIEAGRVPSEPQVAPEARPPWLESRAHRLGPIGRLMRIGATELALAYVSSTTPSDDDDRWRRAFAYDAGGRYHVSHNIVRRQIGGRPWSEPLEARQVQWRLAWPDPFGEIVDAAVAAEKAQNGEPSIDGALAKAIMREESSFIEDIESYAGALGLMQLMPRTALGHDDDIEGDATPERLKTADVNVRVGVDHLFWLARRFDGHPVLMVAAYNAGSGAIDRWMRQFGDVDVALFVEDIPSLQTRGYTKRVIGSYAAYQWLAGRSDLDDRVLGAAK